MSVELRAKPDAINPQPLDISLAPKSDTRRPAIGLESRVLSFGCCCAGLWASAVFRLVTRRDCLQRTKYVHNMA